jgi:hypothetical protein
MIRIAAILALLTIGGCAAAGGPVDGVASYDALAKARADCLAKGQELTLVNGGDPQVLGDFTCKRK